MISWCWSGRLKQKTSGIIVAIPWPALEHIRINLPTQCIRTVEVGSRQYLTLSSHYKTKGINVVKNKKWVKNSSFISINLLRIFQINYKFVND